MKIKMLRYYSGTRNRYQYFYPGGEYSIDDATGKTLVADGYAEAVEPVIDKAPEAAKPKRAVKRAAKGNE
uniref:Uncharacterized protein n=1 Tax=viral metagenome TaxID=1070528 RepID=A0A6M3L8I6_9ZZZZ